MPSIAAYAAPTGEKRTPTAAQGKALAVYISGDGALYGYISALALSPAVFMGRLYSSPQIQVQQKNSSLSDEPKFHCPNYLRTADIKPPPLSLNLALLYHETIFL